MTACEAMLEVGAPIKNGYRRIETIIKIEPYRGRYVEHFDCVLTITNPSTRSRTSRMAYHSSMYVQDKPDERDYELAKAEAGR